MARVDVKRWAAENLGKVRIPVPPPEEQERIVATLDALVNHLPSGLPGEIKAFRQLYERHRDPSPSFQEAA